MAILETNYTSSSRTTSHWLWSCNPILVTVTRRLHY